LPAAAYPFGVVAPLIRNDYDSTFLTNQFFPHNSQFYVGDIDSTHDMACLEFRGIANIEQNGSILVKQLGNFMYGDGATTFDAFTPGVDVNQNYEGADQQPFLTDKYKEIH